jgi:hypothetical protein
VMNHAGDRDKVVLVGHRMGDVRTILALASDTYFAVGGASCGSPARSLRVCQMSVGTALSFKGNPPPLADRRCASESTEPRADPLPGLGSTDRAAARTQDLRRRDISSAKEKR